MKNYILILSVLYVSVPSTLETKELGWFQCTEGGKAAEDYEDLPMVIVQIDLA
jgi:hypothetical protein